MNPNQSNQQQNMENINQNNQMQNVTNENPINQQNQTVIQQQNKSVQTHQKNIKTEFGKPIDEAKKIKIKRFKYKVKEQDGKIIESYFDAETKNDVQSFLINKGYEIISITEDKLSTSLGLTSMNRTKKMNAKDLNFFLTQLSTYIKAGIPLVDSMEILSRQTKNKSVQMLYRKIVFELNKGTTFSVCLEKQGKVFPKMLINMLKTSEMTGDLTGVLDDMAAYYKQQDSNRKQIINAMTYPSVLMIFAITVLTFVITYVVPSFTDMYSSVGSELPMVTQIIMNVSDFVIQNWYYIVLVIIIVVTILTLAYKGSKTAKYTMQALIMHIPVVDDMIKNMGEGIYITVLEGLHVAADAITGDFSIESAGFRIRDGKKAEAVKSFTIAGNFFELIKNIDTLGNEVRWGIPGRTVFGSPDVLVRDMSVAGK